VSNLPEFGQFLKPSGTSFVMSSFFLLQDVSASHHSYG